MSKFKDLLSLTKSEIVLLEAITLVAGYYIGQPSETSFDWKVFFFTLIGVSALALGSGALNQIQESGEDSQMDRTKNRPLPSGRISLRLAVITVLVLFTVGVLLLSLVSIPVLLLGIFAVVSYNGLYTMWWKRKMAYAAIPGAIPGAIPVLIGYIASADVVLDVRGFVSFCDFVFLADASLLGIGAEIFQ